MPAVQAVDRFFGLAVGFPNRCFDQRWILTDGLDLLDNILVNLDCWDLWARTVAPSGLGCIGAQVVVIALVALR